MTVEGGGLGNTYKVAQFHWHWGHVIDEGSEHTYMGEKYPAEVWKRRCHILVSNFCILSYVKDVR